ncbi:hypothetical protein WG922_09830 [Ramlibacter sp. AN1015]|uniref:hypothetical protein n=1 Tax=Ramlibacter sp. AN1015 TaxID=3133428 RepID=UPI0030C07864
MSKKHDFLRNEQSRDKHPDSEMVGSAASVEEQERRASVQNVSPQDRQEPNQGKYGNDHNKMGEQTPTQTNQGQRTPQSRNDRDNVNGGTNVVQARTGGKGAGRGSRGGNVGGSPS